MNAPQSPIRPVHPVESLLGVRFSNPALLTEALTHRSYANEHDAVDNERLEFLGDALLGACTATLLVQAFPALREGQLSRLRTRLVNTATLAAIGRELGLGEHLRRGVGEHQSGPPTDAVLEDAVEALVGAVFTDLGFAATLGLVRGLLAPRIAALDATWEHPKGRLQAITQREGGAPPDYVVTHESGPAHERLFTVEVRVHGQALGRGEARSVRDASRIAAERALERLGDGG